MLREVGPVRLIRFVAAGCALAILKLLPLPPLRSVLLRILGARVGRDTVLHAFTLINVDRGGFRNLRIGPRCFVGENCTIDLAAPVVLEADVTLAPEAMVLTHMNVGFRDHPLQQSFPSVTRGVTIHTGCFVGARATILPGVEVGRMSCIGAASLVNTDVAALTLVAGVPARKVRTLQHPGK